MRSIAWLGLLLVACGGDSGNTDRTTPVVRSATERFDDIQSFLESGTSRSGSHQVVFIGVDGATWNAIDPLIDRGVLPNFKRLKKHGAWGKLRSVPCYVSPPAWTSMNSGYSPTRTGVYTFGRYDRTAKEFANIDATDVKVPSMWDIASIGGKKVAATNIPLAYPVHPVNGIMVSGLMTPIFVEEAPDREVVHGSANVHFRDVVPPGVRSFSRPTRVTLVDSLSTFVVWCVDDTDDDKVNPEKLLVKILSKSPPAPDPAEDRVYYFGLNEFSPWMSFDAAWEGKPTRAWCKMIVMPRPHKQLQVLFSQTFFDTRMSAGQYTYPASLGDELAARFGYYMPSKFIHRQFVPSVTEECTKYASFFYDYDDWDLFDYVFTQTDNIQHLEGFSKRCESVYETIDRFLGELMTRLPEESTVIIASDHGFAEYKWGIDLNRFFERMGFLRRLPGGAQIDHDHTMVFHNMWHLWFNRDLLTADNLQGYGIEVGANESPTDAFARYLQRAVSKLEDVATGKVLPLELTRFESTGSPDDPDMVVQGTYDGYLVEFWNLKRPRDTVVWELQPSEAFDHERDGVFLVWGPHVKDGYDAGTKAIEDIAPTALYLLDLPTAEDMDGKVMFDVFKPDFVAAKKSFTVPDFDNVSREFVKSREETQTLEKKLKSLGYVK